MIRVAIFGGSGFVGMALTKALLSKGYLVKSLNRRRVEDTSNENLIQLEIDLFEDDLCTYLKDVDYVIYNIGIIREDLRRNITYKRLHDNLARRAISASEQVGIKKFILMSANGVERQLTGYEKTKFSAENFLMNSNLHWTIFRPSLIFGDPKDKMEFCTQMKRDVINSFLPIPLFFKGLNILNAGSFQMTPIHVENVADFFVKSITMKESDYQIYELGGSGKFDWKSMMTIIFKSCGKIP